MKTASKIITCSVIVLGLASMIAATPASAGGYYRRSGPDAGAVAGAAIAGMAVGAMVGAMASQPHYDRGDYDRPGYGYDQPRYGYDGYGY
jgi:hypothetical protein